ncbi:MAG: hypothetical protein ABSD31_15855 [Candidatus Binataceae bacterium]|jgi:hypothetical protein
MNFRSSEAGLDRPQASTSRATPELLAIPKRKLPPVPVSDGAADVVESGPGVTTPKKVQTCDDQSRTKREGWCSVCGERWN